ncbi:Retrovirus-related Pol polyprotein from transposon RE1-like protein [Drosera capensis]
MATSWPLLSSPARPTTPQSGFHPSQITSQRIYTDQIMPPPSSTIFPTTSEGFSPQFYHSSSSVAPLIPNKSYNPPPVKSVVTITLSVVEDYLVLRAQMESFLMSYGFIGFMHGSVVSPPMHLLQASSAPVLNPDYFQWQRIDQMVRSWIFATLYCDILVEVLNLKLAREIWDRLHHRFMSVCMARSMELKRKLTSLRKASSDSMEKYLCDIKILADSLAVINSPVSNADLIEHTLMGLGTEYESLIAVFLNAPIAPSFDDIGSKLLLHEQPLPSFHSIRPLRLLLGHSEGVVDSRVVVRLVVLLSPSHDADPFRVRFPDLRKGYLETVRRCSPTDQAFATGLTGGSNEAVWYPDSGASSHMTNTDGYFNGSNTPPGPQ